MSKTMTQATGGHNLKVTMVTVVLAVMVLALTLLVVVRTVPTTSGSANSANQAMSADRSGGSSITHDPYIDRHTEVVARHNGVIPH